MNNYPDIFSRPEFQNFFEAIPGVYLILNPDFTIKEVSETYLKATMTQRTEIIGRGIFTVFPESSATSKANSVEVVTASFNRVLKDKKMDKIDHLRFDILNPGDKEKGFETRYWSLKNMPILNKSTNEVDFIVSSVEDTTEVVRLMEMEKNNNERFLKIFNLSPDAKAIVSFTTGKFLYVNHAFEEMLGMTREEMIGKTSRELNMISQEYRDQLIELIMKTDKLRGLEIQLRAKDGHMVDMYMNIDTIELDGEKCLLGNYIDITERKKIEAKVVRLNKELEQHIKQLEAVNKELESFSYSVSHDLRAPLRAINGYAQILADDYSASVDEDGANMIKIIKKNAIKMGQLIDDLLAFSRLGKKEVQRAEVDMESIVHTVLNELQNSKILDDRVNVKLSPLPKTVADHSLMLQVWTNLISNAIKYSGKKEHPEIEIGAFSEEGTTVYYVKDNGVGFDMKYYNKLFGVFQRLHSVEEFEGTGVGLALVQRILIKHSGKIRAEAEVNQGAVFYFSLGNITE